MINNAPARDPRPVALHATAIAIGARALLIRGSSKCGKSSLALDLLGQSGAFAAPVKLIGDDRVVLLAREGSISVSPHPLIAGLIEKRGHGWFAMPYVEGLTLAGVIRLCDERKDAGELDKGVWNEFGIDLPSLFIPSGMPFTSRSQAVRDWYNRDIGGTPRRETARTGLEKR